MKILSRLWSDENGFVVSSELTLIATIMVLGMIVGLSTIRNQVVQELGDVAAAISRLNQSYFYNGVTGHQSMTNGSKFFDRTDFCDKQGDSPKNPPLCIEIEHVPPQPEI